MSFSLGDIRIITFDVFGTLVDWRAQVEAMFPTKFLQFAKLTSEWQRSPDAGRLSWAAMLKAAGNELNPALPAASLDQFARDFGKGPLFPDFYALLDLRLLAQVGCISNSDVAHQVDVQSSLGLQWDMSMTVEAMCGWKPHTAAWDNAVAHVTRHLGYELKHWLHVSAFQDYDLAPAKSRGVQTCFVPRPGGGSARDVELDPPDLIVSDLYDLVARLQAAKDGPWRYRVRAKCADAGIVHRFLPWMRHEHGRDLLKITGCTEFRVFQINDAEVNCEYIFTSRTALDRYLNGAAAELRRKGREMFSESEVVFERDVTRLVCQGVSRAKRDFA